MYPPFFFTPAARGSALTRFTVVCRGCFKLEAWVDSVEGKKVLVKATLSDGEGRIFDTAESLIINVAGGGRVSDDLKSSKILDTSPSSEP